MHASFSPPDWSGYDIDPRRIDWRKAYLAVGISDMRVCVLVPVCSLNKETSTAEAYNGPCRKCAIHSIPVHCQWHRPELERSLRRREARAAFDCDIQIGLKGSRSFFMLASGQNSSIEMTGNGRILPFSGYFLPDDRRDVTDNEIHSIMEHHRSSPDHFLKLDRQHTDIENAGEWSRCRRSMITPCTSRIQILRSTRYIHIPHS